jgi:methionine-rich copper-binding protein CopC
VPLRAAAAFALVGIIAVAVWFSFLRTRPQPFTTLALTIGSSNRAVGPQPGVGKVKYPLDADALRISLKLPERLPAEARYRVELDNLDNDTGEKRPLGIDAQDAQYIFVVIPAAQLTRGQYALQLVAIKPDGGEHRVEGKYFFNVE